MFAGHTSSPRSMARLLEYLPNSCKMFEEMMADMLKGGA